MDSRFFNTVQLIGRYLPGRDCIDVCEKQRNQSPLKFDRIETRTSKYQSVGCKFRKHIPTVQTTLLMHLSKVNRAHVDLHEQKLHHVIQFLLSADRTMELVQEYIKQFTPTRALRWGAALSLGYTAYLAGSNPNPGEKSTDKASANDRTFRLLIRGDGLFNKLLTVGLHAGCAFYHLSHYADEAFSQVEIAIWTGAMAFLHFRLWAMRTLGEYFTFQVMIREDHKLIAHGPYKYLMHPSYTGMLFGAPLAAYFFTRSQRAVAATVAFMAFMMSMRIPDEEKTLAENFPDTFPAYKAARWRLVPLVF